MNIKGEVKWRQNYYREVEKSIKYCEFLNQKAEVKTRKITAEEEEKYIKMTSENKNSFALKIPRKRRAKNEN